MRAVSALPSPPAGKTFAVSIAILSALALAQILAVLVIYAARTRAALEAARPSITATALPAATPQVPHAAPAATPIPTIAPPLMLSTPAPVRFAAKPSAKDRLLAEAKAFRATGDTTDALSKLQEAAGLDPKDAEVLAEMAMTYELMRLADRAGETWQRIVDLGVNAGPLYELAQLKLKGATITQAPATGGMAGSSPLDAGASPGDADGIPEGSTFGITEAKPTEEADPAAETKLTLRVAVKVRPNTPIDHTKVKIQVFFYDMVDDDQVVLTDADVSYQWVTPHHNWTDTNPEVLDVTYLRTKKESTPAPSVVPEVSATPSPEPSKARKKSKGRRNEASLPMTSDAEGLPSRESGNRKYLGYIVRVYYKEQLQAVRADPTKLLNLFPPPFTAPPAQ